jgi:negative regulator of sigma E activity
VKKKAKVNKSQAIRDALRTYPNLTPVAIAERVSAQIQTKVSPSYVSTIKYSLQARKRVPVKSVARGIKPSSQLQSWTTLANLIKTVGGPDQVREMIDTVELIQKVT